MLFCFPLQTFSDEAHKHKSVTTHTLSFWMWVSMVNAAGRTFYNHLYDPQTYPWYMHVHVYVIINVYYYACTLYIS